MSQEVSAMRLSEQSLYVLAEQIRTQKISPVELVEDVFQQIEEKEQQHNAYIDIQKDRAIHLAKEAEREISEGKYRGPLHGIPIGIKDNIYFANETTTMGSKIHQHFIPTEDATVVKKLREAGAVFLGKLNMHEYAWGATNDNPFYGACRNPYDITKISGGSSGGSGVAIATNMAIGALGTDTGGSIRIPAAFCGIFGLKPTHGLVSKANCFPLAWSLDHVGPMTKTAIDSALMLDVLAGYDAKDPTSIQCVQPVSYAGEVDISLENLRIGINESYFFNQVDDEVEKRVREAIQLFEDSGATIVEVDVPALAHVEYAEMITITSEASAIHHDNLIEREEDFGEDVRFLLKLGELPSAVDYLRAQQIRQQLDRQFQNMFQQVDVLLTPTIPFVAPSIGSHTAIINGEEVPLLDHIIRFTGPFNLTGLPVASVPVGFAHNLPVGMQIVGPAFDDKRVLDVARLYELLV